MGNYFDDFSAVMETMKNTVAIMAAALLPHCGDPHKAMQQAIDLYKVVDDHFIATKKESLKR